jgi:hypothetical protein
MALTAAAGAAQYCMVPTSTRNEMGTEFVRRACALSGFAPLGFRPAMAHVVNRKSLYANCSAPLGLMIWRAQAYRRLMLGRPITPSLPMAHINLPETGQRDVMCVTCATIPATSAPGLGPPLPHLLGDWAHPCHICTRTGQRSACLPWATCSSPARAVLCRRTPVAAGTAHRRTVPIFRAQGWAAGAPSMPTMSAASSPRRLRSASLCCIAGFHAASLFAGHRRLLVEQLGLTPVR